MPITSTATAGKAQRALRESEERLRLLDELGVATGLLTDPEQIMPVALRVLGHHLRVSRCAFAHVQPDGEEFIIPNDYTDGCDSIAGRHLLSLFGPRAVAELRRGQTLVVHDVDAELSSDEGARTFNAIAVKAIICCSLVRQGVFRAMMAVHQTTPRHWTPGEVALVQEVVARCWATIEQRTAEARLRDSEALLRIAGRIARLGGWAIEVADLRVTWSDQVCEILEVPLGTSPTLAEAIAYCVPEHQSSLSAGIQACIDHGSAFDLELQLVTAGKHRIWVRAIGHAERTPAGALVRIQGALQEISDRKQTEAQLMVSDRMASVGTLAAGVAHEINNPLACVTANLSLLKLELASLAAHHPIPAVVLEELQDAQEAAERVRLIVRDLKVFSRTEEDRSGPVDVEQVLESTLRLATNEIRHRARLTRIYGKVPLVEGNESRLGQVFLNLVVNAAQAIVEGDCEANEIRVETMLSPANRVVVKITDTGCGIPPEVQRRLFTPFMTTKPIGVGTGLGLSICHRIVTTLGGEIRFSSEVGMGSRFTVELPLAHSAAVPALADPPAGPSTRRGKVLVVDDEVMVAQTIRRILGDAHEVVTFTSAAQALESFGRGERFDVVFCDLMMPQVTGMDLHAAVVQMDPAQAARMVFVTGGAFTDRARKFLSSVPNTQLEKPFGIQVLRTLVTSMLLHAPQT